MSLLFPGQASTGIIKVFIVITVKEGLWTDLLKIVYYQTPVFNCVNYFFYVLPLDGGYIFFKNGRQDI